MADGAALPRRIDAFVDRIDPDPSNPRRAPGQTGDLDVADILDSVRQEGVRDPLWVRTLPEGRYGLIRGERRWTAARLSGCEWVPCELHDELTPAERLALQISDGTSPLTPLAEAAGMARLRDEHRLEVEKIAARTGRSVRLVRQRLALLTLCDVGRSLLAEGRVSLALALDLATLAKDAQIEAAVALAQRAAPGAAEPLSHREAEYIVRSRRMRLADAGFPLADTTLPGGSCLRCPKRSGAQAELWADACPDKDACTDPACFKARREAHSFRVIEVAKAQRIEVADAGKVKKLYPHGARLSCDSPLVDLDAPCDLVRAPATPSPTNEHRSGGPERCESEGGRHEWPQAGEAFVREDDEDEGDDDRPGALAGCEAWQECEHGCGAWREVDAPTWHEPAPRGWKPPTWREALAKALPAPPAPTLIAPTDGGVRELVEKRTAIAALVDAGAVDAKVAKNEIRETQPAPEKGMDKWAIANKANEIAREEALKKIGAAVAKKAANVGFWRFLAALCVRTVRTPAQLAVEAVLGLKSKTRNEGRAALLAAIAKAEESAARAIVVQILAADANTMLGPEDEATGFDVACRFAGVDFVALRKDAEKAVKPQKIAAKASPKVDQAAASGAAVGHPGAPPPRRASLADALARPGACHGCGCTEEDACPGGCAWADDAGTLCSRCAQLGEAITEILAPEGDGMRGDDLVDALSEMHSEEEWYGEDVAAHLLDVLVKRGRLVLTSGRYQVADCDDGKVSAATPTADRDVKPGNVDCNDGKTPCPLTWADVEALGSRIRPKAAKPHSGANSAENVWCCIEALRAHLAEPHVDISRRVLYALRPSAGTLSFDLAILYLAEHGEIQSVAGKAGTADDRLRVRPYPRPEWEAPPAAASPDPIVTERVTVRLEGAALAKAHAMPCPKCKVASGKGCLSNRGKLGTGWVHVERASDARAQETLPGQAGERRDDDPVAEMALTKLERKLLDVCKTARTVKQAKLACRDFRAVDVDAAIVALGKRGELLEQGDKLVAARAPA